MTPAVDEMVGLELIQQLEFDPPCDVVSDVIPPFGTHPAQFVLRCRGCGDVSLICTGHLTYLRDKLLHPLKWVVCEHCEKKGKTIEALYEVTDL